jgi:hypothetical protein
MKLAEGLLLAHLGHCRPDRGMGEQAVVPSAITRAGTTSTTGNEGGKGIIKTMSCVPLPTEHY